MSQTVRDSRALVRHLRRAATQAKKIKPGAQIDPKASADAIAKEALAGLQARGLVA